MEEKCYLAVPSAWNLLPPRNMHDLLPPIIQIFFPMSPSQRDLPQAGENCNPPSASSSIGFP